MTESAQDWQLRPGAEPDTYAFVQWKGTDVCMDLSCLRCGAHHHVDGFFYYEVRCHECGQLHIMSSYVGYKALADDEGVMDPAPTTEG